MDFIYGCSTDVGIKKRVNQDALGAGKYATGNIEAFFAIICDGVGGLNCGELASTDTVKRFIDWFEYEFPQMAESGIEEADLCERVEYILVNQNERLRNYGLKKHLQLGTTASLLLCIYPNYYIWHVGDSRVYMINNKIHQITVDQSLVQKEVDMGILTSVQAKNDKRRNIILQSMGTEDVLNPSFYKGTFNSGDVFLLCTDGIVHEIEEEELLFTFGNAQRGDKKWIEDCQKRLIQCAMDRGETDNISIITIRVENPEDYN